MIPENRNEVVWSLAGMRVKQEGLKSCFFSWVQHDDHPKTIEIRDWFREHGLRLKDSSTIVTHIFADPSLAMLFKLTFG